MKKPFEVIRQSLLDSLEIKSDYEKTKLILKSIGSLTRGQNEEKLVSKFIKHRCEHDLIPHGWSHTKCRKCNVVNQDDKNYEEVFSEYLKRRSEGMRKAGFSEDKIITENSKIHP